MCQAAAVDCHYAIDPLEEQGLTVRGAQESADVAELPGRGM